MTDTADLLIEARWIVPIEPDCTVLEHHSVVVHKGSGRKMTYGEIAQFAVVPAELPK
ncbi:MAG: hypothetical protein HGA47_08445, partial [Zoogloea sp.]|nr:hypothetical protein [Zoogloea sp.]